MCFNCGGSHSSRRGGEAFSGNSYSTWMNNCGPLFDNPTRADASWLSSGDYDIAFRGRHTHRTVNIFLDGGYSTSSWKTTLLTGFIGLGIQGLGLWALSGLFRRKNDTKAQQFKISPTISFWDNYFAKWKLSNSTLGSGTPSLLTKTPTKPQKTKEPSPANPVENKTVRPMKKQTANFNNSKLNNTVGIKGDVKNTNYNGSLSGYPVKFEIHDSSSNGDELKDEAGNLLADIYYFELQNDAKLQSGDDKKPQYKCVKTELYVKSQDDVTFNGNTFEIESGFTLDNNKKYVITSELQGNTQSDKATVERKNNINYKEGTKHTYPPDNT